MVSVTLICVLAVYIPFAQGNDQDGIRDILKSDLTLLKEIKAREKREDCSSFEGHCRNPAYYSFLVRECQKTCHFCDCADEFSTCDYYQDLCGDEEFVPDLTVFCPVTCGLCEVNTTLDQGNNQDGIRDILKNDITSLKESKQREKRRRTVCIDSYWGDCSSFKDHCRDPAYSPFLWRECQKTCHICEECVDKMEYCESYQDYCDDELWVPYMTTQCPVTCGFCEVNTMLDQGNNQDGMRDILKNDITLLKEFKQREKRKRFRAACADKFSYCSTYKDYCNDPFYEDFLEKHCRKTCDRCGDGCMDIIDCELYQSYCDNEELTATMEYYCSATCGLCEGQQTTPPPTAPPRTEQPIDQGSVECGTRVMGTRIVGGTNAKPGAWPWQVTMDYEGYAAKSHWCGGSIIAPQWIVSAAHCFDYGVDPDQYTIVAGDHNLNGQEGYEQNIPIEKIVIHPDYAPHASYDYDLALIKLQSPLTYNKRVRPVCLPEFDFTSGTKCYVTGWGHTEEGGDIAQILQQAQVPLITRDSCQAAYDDFGYIISERMRCAGYAAGGIDACQGDSGGPLVCSVDGSKWYLMGAVSWGIGCAREGRYGVYADLIDLKNWAQETMNAN